MNSFFPRRYVIQGIFIVIALIMLSRLFYIQVIDKSYFLSAKDNVLRRIPVFPARGLILDRKGKVLVQNEPVYDLMVIPNEVKPFDTLEFCSLIGIDKIDFDKKFAKAIRYSRYTSSIFEKQLSAVTYASFQEKLYEYPGFYVVNRSVRYYPDSIAAQFLGYIGEVNEREIERSEGFYRRGDYIGKTGVERSYEELLRGQRGVQQLMVDAFNRPKGHFADGRYDTLAVSGERLISSLDKQLQKFGEQLMVNKIGSIVAIEPSTGEILAFVSSPTYNPNMMASGRERSKNYNFLNNHPDKPMFIRPIQAEYPPGSIFKVINALLGLQFGSIKPDTRFHCAGGYWYGGRRPMKCTHIHGSSDLARSIQVSCNTYYGNVYAAMIDRSGMRPVNGFKRWREGVAKFNIGSKLDIDLPHERKGLLPTDSLYTKRYRNDRWRSGYNISLSIGQGELGITPLQMANVAATVANRGFFYKPHLVKAIGEKKQVKPEYTKKNYVGIDAKHFEPVIQGMSMVVNQFPGTATYSAIHNIEICGKTGTVQNPGEDHSVFFAFAPRNNPKIAIAVVVENGGHGSTWAAPIASLMIEKYITDSTKRDKFYLERILKGNLLPRPKVAPKPVTVKKPDSTSNKPKQKPSSANDKAILRND